MSTSALVDAIAAHDNETIAQAIAVCATLADLDPKVRELSRVFDMYESREVGAALVLAALRKANETVKAMQEPMYIPAFIED